MEKEKIVIEITCRLKPGDYHPYHAQMENHPEIWGCGDSPTIAIGDLIKTHSGSFNIEIKNL